MRNTRKYQNTKSLSCGFREGFSVFRVENNRVSPKIRPLCDGCASRIAKFNLCKIVKIGDVISTEGKNDGALQFDWWEGQSTNTLTRFTLANEFFQCKKSNVKLVIPYLPTSDHFIHPARVEHYSPRQRPTGTVESVEWEIILFALSTLHSTWPCPGLERSGLSGRTPNLTKRPFYGGAKYIG